MNAERGDRALTCPHCGQVWHEPEGSDAETIYSAGVLAVRNMARHFRSAHGDEDAALDLEEVLASMEERREAILVEIRRALAGETDDEDLDDD